MNAEYCLPLGFADFCLAYGLGDYLLTRESFTFFGLMLNLVGVAVLLVWGLPVAPMYSRGSGSDPRLENQQKKVWNRRVRIVRVCLLLIALGFALQAFALFLL